MVVVSSFVPGHIVIYDHCTYFHCPRVLNMSDILPLISNRFPPEQLQTTQLRLPLVVSVSSSSQVRISIFSDTAHMLMVCYSLPSHPNDIFTTSIHYNNRRAISRRLSTFPFTTFPTPTTQKWLSTPPPLPPLSRPSTF